MNYINLITKYSTRALDAVLRKESVTSILRAPSKWVNLDFTNGRTVKVASFYSGMLGDYHRVNSVAPSDGYMHYQGTDGGDGYPKTNARLDWEEFTLPYDRAAQIQIDELDNEETAGLAVMGATTQFGRTAIVPETDALLFSDITKKTSTTLGNQTSKDYSSAGADSTILMDLLSAFKVMADNEVPEEDQVIFVSTQVKLLIDSSKDLTRFLSVGEYKDERDVSFNITTFQGRPLIVVPPSRFYTDILLDPVNGYYPSATSKPINFAVVARGAVNPIVKLNKFKVFSPEVVQNADAYLVNFHIYHGNFIPKNKVPAVYVSVGTTNASATTNTLALNIVAGETAGSSIIEEIYTKPFGLNYDKIKYGTTAFTLHADASSTGTEVKIGEEFTPTSAKGFFALLDARGIVIATTPAEVTGIPVGD